MTITGMKEARAFLDAVKAMRQAQKKYFKTRKQEDLIAAKRLEAAVDASRLPEYEAVLNFFEEK